MSYPSSPSSNKFCSLVCPNNNECMVECNALLNFIHITNSTTILKPQTIVAKDINSDSITSEFVKVNNEGNGALQVVGDCTCGKIKETNVTASN